MDHGVLLQKIYRFGLSENIMNLFKSYLQNRFFVVKHDGNTSGKFHASSGVPQGSNLGPLFFLLFINDLPDVIRYSKCLLFADDVKIFKPIQTVRDCSALQKDINSVLEWSAQCKLDFNIKKCNVMSITRQKDPIIFDYCMDNESLKRVYEFKDLGITYDYKLSFKKHIENVVKSANRALGFTIRQTSLFVKIDSIKLIYVTLVRSKLEYGSVIWNGEYQTILQELERIQNKFLRYLYFKKYFIRPDYNSVRTTQLRSEFKIPSLDCRRKMFAILFLYKIINNHINSAEILSVLPFNVPPRPTRSAIMFNIPFVSSTLRSPLLTMLRLANNITCLHEVDWHMPLITFRHLIYRYIVNLSV